VIQNSLQKDNQAGVYIHIPFCKTKCPYCSFSSAPLIGQAPITYLDAVINQAQLMASHPWTKTIQFSSLFIGGGTPTIYRGGELEKLIDSCRSLFPFTMNPEITVETNPNTVSRESLTALHRAGVNRLSIGVQSFSDNLLKTIGRSHTSSQARESVQLAQEIGFETVNIDLIFGLPGQTVKEWQASLDQALAFDPGHISLYELMIEEETPFAQNHDQGILNLPSEDDVVLMLEAILQRTEKAGYQRYEISNYAKPGKECRHNMNYWQNGQYLGLGASAFSCIEGMRIKNVDAPALFITLVNQQKSPFESIECLSLEASFRESVIMGLRMVEGISVSDMQERYGISMMDYYGSTFKNLEDSGLLQQSENRIRLSAKGFPIANQVLSQLV